jgi:Ca2+-binding RTX toxin-like protein
MSESISVELKTIGGVFTFYEWRGTSGADVIEGFDNQNNDIYGLAGADILSGGAGSMRAFLAGEGGNDTLKGGLGADQLVGGAGADLMMGGQGDDWYFVDNANDIVVERSRWAPERNGDTIISSIDFSLQGSAVENLKLSGFSSQGTGNSFANEISGDNGNDTLDGGRGIDSLVGGLGDDTYILRHKADIAEEPGVNARQKSLNAAQNGHDTVLAHNSFKLMLGIEDIVLQDVLGKNGQAVNGLTAIGNNLDNLVVGNATDNSLNGRTGNDTLTGGAGADDFIFTDTLGAQHADLITDFATQEDRIVIKGALVNVAAGVLDDTAFHLGNTAQTADHRFLFDGTTLRYDADGDGAGVAVDVAVFEGAPILTADDIFIT